MRLHRHVRSPTALVASRDYCIELAKSVGGCYRMELDDLFSALDITREIP